jgi:EH_Signature domain
MSPLESLQLSLSAVNVRFVLGPFGEPKAMGKTAENLEQKYGKGREPDPELVLKTLRCFSQTGTLSGYRDIRNVCYGTLVPIQSGKTLVSNRGAFESLLGIVDQYQSEPKKLKRCFQALISAYLSLDGCESGSDCHAQWDALRQRLAGWLPQLSSLEPRPDWLAVAFEHRNLFGDDRTSRYGVGILKGDHTDFESVCAGLGIDRYSWVRRRVVISAVEVATREGDNQFLSYVDQLIELLGRNEGVRNEGAVMLLSRYAQQAATPEHITLRAFAIDVFGNPLITANKQRWFEVSQEAREMVANWLKGFLIERFFELLSHDGRTDKRRPKFWLKHRGSIENMWFILGPASMSSWNQDFQKLRETMGNQCLSLEGSTAGNNAFVMKIGKVYVVEFGETGNATFLFDQNAVPFELTGKYLHRSRLRSARHLERLLHMDGLESWESKFSDALARYGVYPDDSTRVPLRVRTTAPASPSVGGVFTPPNFQHVLKQFCNERGLRYNDSTPNGKVVVYTDSSNSFISGKLGQWGFTYEREFRCWVKPA